MCFSLYVSDIYVYSIKLKFKLKMTQRKSTDRKDGPGVKLVLEFRLQAQA